ncbi:MAG: GntR family transcriptional regulator [Huintestinicola sp.]
MFDIDLQSRTPIYEQLYRRVIELVVRNQLKKDDKLPSVRELAKSLGVNPNTVSKAFQMLERDGVIYSLSGRGSFIKGTDSEAVRKNAEQDFRSAVSEAYAAGLTSHEMISCVKESDPHST